MGRVLQLGAAAALAAAAFLGLFVLMGKSPAETLGQSGCAADLCLVSIF
jgi:hypothetical protein